MSTVDEIMASGFYRSRRGRCYAKGYSDSQWFSRGLPVTPGWVRLQAERDLHRDECEGLFHCTEHPVPIVIGNADDAGVFSGTSDIAEVVRDTLSDAMDAAYALAVSE